MTSSSSSSLFFFFYFFVFTNTYTSGDTGSRSVSRKLFSSLTELSPVTAMHASLSRPASHSRSFSLFICFFSISISISECVSLSAPLSRFLLRETRLDEPNSYRPSGAPISCALRTDHRAARPRRFRRGVSRRGRRRTRRLARDLMPGRFLAGEAIASVDGRANRRELARSRSQDGRRTG